MSEILEKLKDVIYPGFKKSIVEFGFVKKAEFIDENMLIVLDIPSNNEKVRDELTTKISEIFGKNLILKINTPELPKEQSNSQSGKNLLPNIKNFVMVSSGKGGVGKSTTTTNLAISLAKMGLKVGLLDADIYGPNIPRMFGIQNSQPAIENEKIKPILANGVYVVSIGNLMGSEALIWRGAMIMKVINQLLTDVLWGDLDVLVFDMPPGTGDAQISLAQNVPVNAGICVTTPQLVALDDSTRSLDMFNKLHIPIAGIIENMSGFICPDNNKEYEIFGKGTTKEFAKEYNTQILAQIPIEISLREAGDSGKPVSFYEPNSISAKRYDEAAKKLWEFLQNTSGDNFAIQPK